MISTIMNNMLKSSSKIWSSSHLKPRRQVHGNVAQDRRLPGTSWTHKDCGSIQQILCFLKKTWQISLEKAQGLDSQYFQPLKSHETKTGVHWLSTSLANTSPFLTENRSQGYTKGLISWSKWRPMWMVILQSRLDDIIKLARCGDPGIWTNAAFFQQNLTRTTKDVPHPSHQHHCEHLLWPFS